jgi:5-methylcytosine-specific restriction endonuclease McrA
MTYQGLPPVLKRSVYERDAYRCRWCGVTNAYAYDVHHVEYRRGESYDVIENLITLCRGCHNYVHDSYKIPKQEAQRILKELIVTPGMVGLSIKKQKPGNNSLPNVGRLLS